jgi:uncharacterized protein YegL
VPRKIHLDEQAAKKSQNSNILAFIVDKSSSMASCRSQVISGYNEYMQTMKEEVQDPLKVYVTFFDTVVTKIHDGIPIADVPNLTSATYCPGGMTAMYDAIGETLTAIKASLKGKKIKPKITVVIQTDGDENSSKEFDRAKINALIAKLEKEGNWTFVFMGADQDAWKNASKIGIAQGNTLSYKGSETQSTFRKAALCSTQYMASADLSTKSFFQPDEAVDPTDQLLAAVGAPQKGKSIKAKLSGS